jgi:PAS domain S-box-containing protein
MSFIVTVVLNGIAITQLHMLDITPVANSHILEAISDGYLVLSESGLVLNYNKRFEKLFGTEYGIEENRKLSDCVRKEDISRKTAVYNMMTAIRSSREGMTKISYEQAVTATVDGKTKMCYFIVDVLPLEVNQRIVGFAMLFKDITKLRESMQTRSRFCWVWSASITPAFLRKRCVT